MTKAIMIIPPHADSLNIQYLTRAAQKISDHIEAVAIGPKAPSSLPKVIDKLWHYPIDQKSELSTEQCYQIINTYFEQGHLITLSGTFSKELMPFLAAKLNIMPMTDVIAINTPHFKRAIFAGNIIESITSSQERYVLSVRPSCFKQEYELSPLNAHILDPLDIVSSDQSLSKENSDLPDLLSANVVVSGGRGFASEENFKLLHQLAKHYGAGLGASRAAVDQGYIANDHQVGQTGKIIAPNVYIAFGISGAVQHLAGMKDSGTIIAVNTDPDAPIFEYADIGYCGDLFEVINRLLAP
tara:strand:+ start:2031 stop:2924 length:894 start_codon:yes stop_codon:yes gene_type:complete